MIVFKIIQIDLKEERARIKRTKYTKRQTKALLGLCDLFEQGKWQECLNYVNDKKNFPYNTKEEYPETEHIGKEIGNILRTLAWDSYYTLNQLKEEFDKKPK